MGSFPETLIDPGNQLPKRSVKIKLVFFVLENFYRKAQPALLNALEKWANSSPVLDNPALAVRATQHSLFFSVS